MNKKIFMAELGRKLHGLPKEDFEDALEYYDEYFYDAGVRDDQDVTEIVGSPDEVARRILDEALGKELSPNAPLSGQVEGAGSSQANGIAWNTGARGPVAKKKTSPAKVIWLVILSICAAPIAIPMAAVLFAVLICVLALALAFVVTGVACGIGFIVLGLGVLPGIVWAGSFPQVLVFIGMFLMALALAIIVIWIFVEAAKGMVMGIAKLFRKIVAKKNGGKANA